MALDVNKYLTLNRLICKGISVPCDLISSGVRHRKTEKQNNSSRFKHTTLEEDI